MLATWRKKITHTTEMLLPRGTPIGEHYKALAFAWARYCEETGHDPNNASDDWARIDADDEHVIIRFETQKETQ